MDHERIADPVFIARAAEITIAHADNHNFSGTELAALLSLSREQTHRKIKKNTNLSTGKFISYIRLLKACYLVQKSSLTISEIAYKVGFESPAYFNKCFKDAFKINPGDLKRTGTLVLEPENEISFFWQLPSIHTSLSASGCFPTFQEVDKKPPIPEKKKLRVLVPILVILLMSILLSAYFLKNQKSVLAIDKAKIGRVGVVPFINQTGDSLYAPLGDIVSSWISSRLDEVQEVKMVPYLTMKAYLPYLGVLPNDPEGRPTLSDVVGASYLVSGNYYLSNNKLVVETHLVDAKTQEIIYSIPLITGPKDSAMQVIEKVRMKVAGALSNFEEVKVGKRTPPNYTAYVHYLRGLTELESGVYPQAAQFHFEEASRIEPDFVMPKLFLTWLYKDARLDSVVEVLHKMTNTTSYERTIGEEIYQLFQRNYEASLRIALDVLEEYPQDYYFNMVAGHRAKSLFRPALSLDIWSRLEDPFPDDFGKVWHYYKVWNVTESLLMLGKEEEAVNYLNSIPQNLHNPALPILYVAAYSRLGKSPESIEEIIESACRLDVKWCADYYAAAGYQYSLDSKADEAKYFCLKAKQLMRNLPDEKANLFDIVDVLFLLSDYPEAKKILKQATVNDPGNLEPKIYLAYIESCLGNKESAEKIFKAINANLIFWRRHEFQYQKDYLEARMYALSGEKEKALAHLKLAYENGQLRHHWDYERDIFFKNLFGHPEFQKIVAPKN
jgi:AraC-like DNA-binding protein/TolB-like protein